MIPISNSTHIDPTDPLNQLLILTYFRLETKEAYLYKFSQEPDLHILISYFDKLSEINSKFIELLNKHNCSLQDKISNLVLSDSILNELKQINNKIDLFLDAHEEN